MMTAAVFRHVTDISITKIRTIHRMAFGTEYSIFFPLSQHQLQQQEDLAMRFIEACGCVSYGSDQRKNQLHLMGDNARCFVWAEPDPESKLPCMKLLFSPFEDQDRKQRRRPSLYLGGLYNMS